MIADDEPAIRDWFAGLVRTIPGMRLVAEATAPAEAMELARTRQVDLAVLDIGFPRGSGFEILKALKAQPQAPIAIMFTNHAQAPYPDRCRRAGAAYFFDKSTEFEALEALLRSMADRREAPPQPGCVARGES